MRLEPHELRSMCTLRVALCTFHQPCSHSSLQLFISSDSGAGSIPPLVAVYCQLGATNPHLAQTLQSLKSTIRAANNPSLYSHFAFFIIQSNPISATKKKSRASGFFFLYFSLFSFHSSLFSEIPERLFQRRDKREERKEKVAFLPLVEKH